MRRQVKAVVCREWGAPVQVETITLDGPKRDEVTIKVAACGVCHSDHSATTGKIQYPPPLIVGHEAAGVVVEVGEGVTDLKEGDYVVSTFITMCGKCRNCVRGRPVLCENARKSMVTLPDGTVRTHGKDGEDLNVFGACGVMAEYATLHVNNCVKIEEGVPMSSAALVGCAVITGVGSVFNTAQLEPGSRAAVFGIGGVGLNAIQGCVTAGAEMVIAVDTNDDKLEMAKQFGATHTINAKEVEDVSKAIKKLSGGGVDYAFECVGNGKVVEQAYKALTRAGTVVVVGVSDIKDTSAISPFLLAADERSIKGSWLGSARPQYDFPRILNLYKANRLKLDELVTQTYSIDDAPKAFEDMLAGKNARGVIVFE